MTSVFNELRLRPIAGGILSLIPGLYKWWDNQRPTGNTASSSYSKGIWEFHRDNYRRYTQKQHPYSIAELGPGATLGTCIAALCDGVERAVGLDVCPYAGSSQLNQEMLDELWTKPRSDSKFEVLAKAIRKLGSPLRSTPLKYVAPWMNESVIPEGGIDLVFSHSVLEHVDQPADAYKACFRWLKPNGIMSHKIDHSSHGITNSWNGHYAIPRWLWRIIRGGRPYLLNRLTPSEHRALIKSAGFEIISEILVNETDADRSTACSLKISEQDTECKTTAFVCRKPASI